MRFTASKETRYPYTDLNRISDDSLFICFKKVCKVFLQLSRHNIFFQFLCGICAFTLTDHNNALNLTVNRLRKHILDLHSVILLYLLLLDQLECTIIIVIFYFTKQDQLLLVINTGKEHNHRHPHKCLMKVVQDLMRTKYREAFPDPR